MRELRQAVAAAGFDLAENQLGPLVTQMVGRAGYPVLLIEYTGGGYEVKWDGKRGIGETPLEAAMRCCSSTTAEEK